MKDVKDKVAFITGAGAGMGLGMAKAFSAAGMKVVIADIRRDHLDDAMQYFNDKGAAAHAIQLDVTDREAYARAADEAEEVFGKIHVLVNNAGLGITGEFLKTTFADWDWLMGVNLGGVINGVQIIVPRIVAHGEGGHVVSTSSMSGLVATRGTIVYNTAKFAVCGLMETLYSDLQPHNIGASVYLPGAVNTSIYKGEEIRPEEFADSGYTTTPEEIAEWQERMKGLLNQIGMDPVEVGERVLRGIQNNDLFIFSHTEFKKGIEEKFECLLASMPDEDPDPVRAEAVSFLTSYPPYVEQRDKKLKEVRSKG
ncbi:MAG: SDR family NAD(P)-dependent oxidoreductase [Gammaproteobacteria bacterium]